MTTDNGALANLSASGVAIWLDDLSRDVIASGELAALTGAGHVVGITTNPSIFANALKDGAAYETQLRELAAAGTPVSEALMDITRADVTSAADILRPVFEASNGHDGWVSIEVDPNLAGDGDATTAQARELHDGIDRPNVFVKIPATEASLGSIEDSIAAGISINVTLIFSLDRYRAVVDAYLTGLERALAGGRDLSQIHSVASFFISRVDVAIDPLLDECDEPGAKDLRSRIGIANARLAYGIHLEVLKSERWAALAAAGARPQRPLWASTGVKDPSLSDTLYVDELVASGTINTMPRKTLDAVAEHGSTATPNTDSITPNLAAAQADLDALAATGIDLERVTNSLETDGVAKFIDSWSHLTDTVQAGLDQFAPRTSQEII